MVSPLDVGRRLPRVVVGGDVPVGELGDIGEVGRRGCGEQPRGGVAVDQLQHPDGGEVLGEQGQLGEGQRAQVRELVEQARALADDGLEAAGDLAQTAEFL
ncbi:MAG TPA: hypothetical protein VEL76_03605 [Gemmataceae bacterium]|nr:hypothetical protein [Gemmataceae bacterium]